MNLDVTKSVAVPLPRLFEDFPLDFTPRELPVVAVGGIAIDSRTVRPGDLFVARRGASVDGHAYIASAIERGAAAVVGDREMRDVGVPYVRVEDSCRALTWLAAAFYGQPGRKLSVVGVTGTDGKTTTSNLLYHILQAAGIKAGLISTVNAVIGDQVLDTGFHVTTPDAQDVQHYLALMFDAGLTHVVLETTSHGLAQYRVDAAQYDIAVVTNITHEHVNDHGSLENYRRAKARLFELLGQTIAKPQGNPRLAVLNRDDSSYDYLQPFLSGPQISYGLDPDSAVRARGIQYSPEGISFQVTGPDYTVQVESPLIGAFNVSNCLAAFCAAVHGLAIDPETAARGLGSLAGIPGRMERIRLGQSFTVLVDFAHTPNALRVAIETVRPMTTGKVIAIFGSAGLRDRQKRRMMAETSADLADVTILTAEDPRTESLDSILAEMAAGAKSHGAREGETLYCIPDRGEAIRHGVRMAAPGDIVIACGKGHEQSMCFGTIEYPWDDRTAMKAALSEYLGIPGPAMPGLPTS
jgi:UDP-N-acetylmuramoyl-L-alanyl-D-glutamate--2,6-diaminopimelate ligase